MKVIVYSRVSTDKQSLAQQERTVNEWLSARSLEATEVISDEGISGGVSYKDRALGIKILPLLEKGDILIVSEISRLGRSMSDINKLVVDELKPKGVRLVIVQMGIDIDTANIKATDQMVLYALSFAAQVEKELIQERTKSALEIRKQKLATEGSFVSKTGNVRTHLGREKGCDTTKAVAASAISTRKRAQENPNNKIIWGILSEYAADGNTPTTSDFERATARFNAMGIKTSTGMEFNVSRARNAFHNLKKTYRHA